MFDVAASVSEYQDVQMSEQILPLRYTSMFDVQASVSEYQEVQMSEQILP